MVADNLGPSGNYLFIAPFTHDPVSTWIWLGGEYLYRGANFGQSWSKAGIQRMLDGGRISAVAVSPRSNALVASGTDKGDILLTRNATSSAVGDVLFSADRPRSGWVTSIAFDPQADSGGQTWLREETGFGPAVTMWLSIVKPNGGTKYLFACTHGRGAWRVALR